VLENAAFFFIAAIILNWSYINRQPSLLDKVVSTTIWMVAAIGFGFSFDAGFGRSFLGGIHKAAREVTDRRLRQNDRWILAKSRLQVRLAGSLLFTIIKMKSGRLTNLR
jgi:hypothetical protein